MIATDTPVRNELENIKASKICSNKMKTVTRKLFNDFDPNDVEVMSLHSQSDKLWRGE